MKKLILSIIALSFITSTAFAGKMKDILIDTEDAIYSEFQDAGDRKVLSISEHKLQSTNKGVSVSALVVTENIYSKVEQTWDCLVSFEKINGSFTPVDVNCN
jgi:hypothetical protein